MAQRGPDRKSSGRNFSLQKYYLDMVTSEGLYFIGYSAELNWGSIRVSYSATLHHPKISGISSGPVLSSSEGPIENDPVLTWSSTRLGFEGQWQRLVSGESQILHQHGSGLVEWNCLQPSARVVLKTASDSAYHGLGYVEFLRMTMPPWQLGLKNLLWGRFVSEEHSVVWIEWRGKHPLALLICNGETISNPAIFEDGVRCTKFELSLERAETIRTGSIGKTLVSKIPSILRTDSIEFLGGQEEKYVSRGTLAFVGGSSHTGWVVHERVSWG
jgi:hypothetical protein